MDRRLRRRRDRLAGGGREPGGRRHRGGAALSPALELRGLSVTYRSRRRDALVLRAVSLQVGIGQSYGMVGESGSGKSTVALAALRALPRSGTVCGGSVHIAGQDVMALGPAALRHLRAQTVAMVDQDASLALNPTLTIGRQLDEAYAVIGAPTAAAAMLARVQIPDPPRVLAAYPHELSGGMQQRVAIAMALARHPALLVLDEPTTGLDATVAAEILDLITTLRRDDGTALLFISHNLAVIGQMCDRIGVLYAGTLVEEGDAADVLARPMHPYTAALLRCLPAAGRHKSEGPLPTIAGEPPPPGSLLPGCVFAPRCDRADALCRTVAPPATGTAAHHAFCHHPVQPGAHAALAGAPSLPISPGAPVLQGVGLSKHFAGAMVLDDVTLSIDAGQTLGLVGESGSGKTTLARILLGLVAPEPRGVVALQGRRLAGTVQARARADRQAVQMVFQNPGSALNRAHTVRTLLEHPLARLARLSGPALAQARAQALAALLAAVRLTPAHLAQRPGALSGGLKQRVAIARAFAGTPRVVVCDEPTSALDVSVQASILNLLVEMQARTGVGLLFISHDLGVVRYLADRIAVLYRGTLVETGPADAVFAGPHHPYTAALLAAVPGAGSVRARLASASASPGGCVFAGRCPLHLGLVCDTQPPPPLEEAGHAIRCHIPRSELPRS